MIYVIGASGCEPEFVKIGKAVDVEDRRRTLQTGSPHELRAYVTLDWPDEYEGKLHRALSAHRVRGEWFRRHEDMDDVFTLCNEYPNLAQKLLDEHGEEPAAVPRGVRRIGVTERHNRWDRDKYNAWMKDYMRRKRSGA